MVESKEMSLNEKLEKIMDRFEEMDEKINFGSEFATEYDVNWYTDVRDALTELQQIKSAKPSEALECLEEVEKAPSFMGGNPKYLYHIKSEIPFMEDINTIKQALMKFDSLQDYLDVDDNSSWTFKNKSGIEVTVITKKRYDELRKAPCLIND